MKPPLSPSQHSAFPMAPVPEGSCSCSGLCPGWSGQVSAPSLPAAPSAAAAPPGPVSLCCSGCLCLFPVLQLCSLGLCSVLLLEVPLAALARGTGASPCIPRCSAHLEAPQSLRSPPPGAAPPAPPPHGDALEQPRSHPLTRGRLQNKANPGSTSVTARGGEHCCHCFAAQLPFPKSEVAEEKRW